MPLSPAWSRCGKAIGWFGAYPWCTPSRETCEAPSAAPTSGITVTRRMDRGRIELVLIRPDPWPGVAPAKPRLRREGGGGDGPPGRPQRSVKPDHQDPAGPRPRKGDERREGRCHVELSEVRQLAGELGEWAAAQDGSRVRRQRDDPPRRAPPVEQGHE